MNMPTKIENALKKIDVYDSELAQNIAGQLKNKQYLFEARNKQAQRIEYDSTVLGLLQEIMKVYSGSNVFSYEMMNSIEHTSTRCLQLLEELIYSSPKGIDICKRNPLQELPQLIRIVFESVLCGNAVPFVVPVCPDLKGYSLQEGLWRSSR